MKTLKTLLPLACLLLLPLTTFAAPIAYPFRVTDNSGVLVAGATVSIGATTLTSGSATVTPAAAGEKLLATNAAPAATVSVTLLDYGTGDYALVYDPAVSGELYIPLTVSKGGSTITGGAALIALVASADSSTIIGVNTTTATINTTTTSTNALATGINTQTAKIATNAMDSPNEVTSQGQAGTTSTAVAALPAANATAVWGAAVKTITGGTVTTVTNAVALPTTVPAGYGGSTGDTPGTTTLLARLGSPVGATLAADLAAVKADTGNLVTGVAALPAAVWAYTAADGLTHQQTDALKTAILARGFSVSYNASTRTQVTTYFKADGVTALATTTVIYDTTGRAVTRTTAFTNLP